MISKTISHSKICTGCGLDKPLAEFGKHKASRDGIRARCRPCEVLANLKYRATEQGARTLNEYRSRPEVRQAMREAVRRWVATPQGKRTKRAVEARYPERRLARRAVGEAIRIGVIAPLPCWTCGADAEAHHADYGRPMDVVWLCPAHHKQLHAECREAA